MCLQPDDALLVIDVQRDFLPGGALAVARGDEVVAPINRLGERFDRVLLTQDWHPLDHISFAANHPGGRVFETVPLAYGPQILWPTHCVQGTPGADFAPALHLPAAELIIRKGCRRGIDSYSAFLEADRRTPTGLAGYLRERGVGRLFLAGLATDFCVAWTALDACRAGFATVIVQDACRAIDQGGSLDRALCDMREAGVAFLASNTL